MRETEFKMHISDLNKPFSQLSNKVKLLRKLPHANQKLSMSQLNQFNNLDNSSIPNK